MNSDKIITFGEIMLRLTPPDYNTIEGARSFIANYGGGEANVSVSLARFGHRSYFVTRLPNNQLGDGAIKHLRSYNVDTSYIDRGGTNMGIYFLETGFAGRPSKVLYNRKYAAITSIHSDKFNFDEIFKDAKWFHFSGITLALGQKVRDVLFDMLKAAKKYNVYVSFDANFRKTLWTLDEASSIYQKVWPYINLFFANPFDSEFLFGNKRDLDLSIEQQDIKLLNDLVNKYNGDKLFATKRVIHSSTDNELQAYYLHKNKLIKTQSVRFNIYDRIGGGDAFAAGVIHGLIKTKHKDPKFAVNFGLSAAILKHTLWGDIFTLIEEDVLNYMNTNFTGNSVIR